MARSVAWAITYLTLRTVLNSLRRLLASPLRALLALAIVGYLAYDEVSELLWLGALLGASGFLLWRRARLYEVCASLAQARVAEQHAESDPYGAYLRARAERHADRRLVPPRASRAGRRGAHAHCYGASGSPHGVRTRLAWHWHCSA